MNEDERRGPRGLNQGLRGTKPLADLAGGSLADRAVEAARGIDDRIGAVARGNAADLAVKAARGLDRGVLDAAGRIGGFDLSPDVIAQAGILRSMDELSRKLRPIGSFSVRDGLMGVVRVARARGEVFGNLGAGIGSLAAAPRFANMASLADWAKPFGGGGIDKWAGLQEPSGIAAARRSLLWADGVGGRTAADLAGILKAPAGFATSLGSLTSAASAAAASRAVGLPSHTPNLDRLLERHRGLEGAALKMSLFAGGLDVLGARNPASESASRALLGEWRTRPGLPSDFWRDRQVRARHYREADVDPGLVDADNATLIEVLVESGVVEGDRKGGTVTAVIQAGPVTVRVTAARPRLGAYRAISAFEIALRAFVAAKIEAAVMAADEEPKGWFRRRMPADVLKRVRERREDAKRAGEAPAAQIAYVDLGDFIPIVTQNANWPIFEPVFGSREAFKVDMERLNAIRRPTAHPRPIDAVQLTEATFTIHRLTLLIESDGGWDPAWKDDEG